MNIPISDIAALRSTQSVKALANSCSLDPEAFDSLLLYCSDANKHIATYASWTATHAFDMQPDVVGEKQIEWLFRALETTQFNAVRRNLMRILQTAHLNPDHVCKAADYAFQYFKDPKQDIAVRAFSVTVLENCLYSLPEIAEEAAFVIERELPYTGPAIRARSMRFLKTRSKMKNNFFRNNAV